MIEREIFIGLRDRPSEGRHLLLKAYWLVVVTPAGGLISNKNVIVSRVGSRECYTEKVLREILEWERERETSINLREKERNYVLLTMTL